MPEVKVGDIIDSRYQLKKYLGGGRVGKVFLARDLKKRCNIAIKILKECPDSEKEKELFKREFEAVKNLNHPGVVKVYEKGNGYFTMEYVEGDSLYKLKGGDISQILEVGIDITRVLEYIHKQGVIHRDLKPENIKITPSGNIKILDFGFAIGYNVKDLISTRHFSIEGTLNYMAPEVIKGFEVDPRADLYSLGIIFYELVTGTLPFKSHDIISTVIKQVETTPPPPSKFNSNITPGFEDIIMKLISKSPIKRFQSADELLSALLRLAGKTEILKIKIEKGKKFLKKPKFYGRTKELELLETIFKKTLKGKGSIVIVEGEEGLGKTRLLEEFQEKSSNIEKCIELKIKCEPSFSTNLGVFSELIYKLFKILEKKESKEKLQEISRKWGPTLLPLIPALTHKSFMVGVVPEENIKDQDIRKRLCQFFIDISKNYVLKIFIDNLQWLDYESSILFKELAFIIPNYPIFIAGTYRESSQIEENYFQRVLSILKIKKLCIEIILKPLSKKELANFISSMIEREDLPESFIDRIYEVSRGFPLIAEETIKNIAEEGLIYKKGGIWQIEIDDPRKIKRPSLLEDVLIEKYEKLDKKKALVLETSAIIGNKFTKSFLEKILRKITTSFNEEEFIKILNYLIKEGFLIKVSKDDEIEENIRFPIRLAELLYEKIPLKKKQKFHEIIAKELEKEEKKDIKNIAYHYFYAKKRKKALPYLIKAAEISLKEYDYKLAIKYNEIALEIAEQKGFYNEIIKLYKKLGEIYSLLGKYETSLSYYFKGLNIAKEKKLQLEDFYKSIGKLYIHKGEIEESKKYFEKLLELNKDKKEKSEELLLIIADVHIASGEFKKALDLLEKALKYIKNKEEKEEQRANIYKSLGYIYYLIGDWETSLSYYLKSLYISHKIKNQRLKANLDKNIAEIYINQGQIEKAYRYLEDGLYICYLTGDRELKVLLELEVGKLFKYKGNIGKANEIFEESVDLSIQLGVKYGIAQGYLYLGESFYSIEKDNLALEYILKSKELFKKLKIQWKIAECDLILGKIYISLGEYEKSLKAFKESEERFKKLDMKLMLARVYSNLGELYRIKGELEKANKNLNIALKIARKYRNDILLGKIHINYGLFCGEKGLIKETLEHFISATVFLERVTCLLELAKSFYEYGKTLINFEKTKGEKGFIKVAKHQLEKAKEIYKKSEITSLLNKTLILIKECEREEKEYIHKKDITIKLREFSRELFEIERDTLKELDRIKEEFLKDIGDDIDMDKEKLLEEFNKKIEDLKSDFLKKIEELSNQNSNLLSQVEKLKAERESLITLQKISNTINSVLDSQKLLNLIMDMVVKELRAERGFLVLKGKESEDLSFKAVRNIDKEELSQEDFNISRSIVKRVITTGEPILTSDAQTDSRFQTQSIMDLKLRSILCVPFKLKEKVIGAVYVDNRFVSGLFTEKDLDFLISFSNQAAIAIENAFLYEELREKERIEQEISIAAKIQAGLLPKTLPDVPGVEVYGKMIPARKVGGDYYDFIVSPDNTSLSVVIGDVSGKGVPAGLVMVMARLTLHLFLNENNSTKDTLLAANKVLKDNTEPFIFMSLLLSKWDSQKEKFVYTGAGHENLIICRKDKTLEVIPAGGVVLGVKEDIDKFLEEREIKLEKGDMIVLYTDGVTECISQSGEMLELDGFLEILKNHLDKSPEEIVHSLIEDLKKYMGTREQHDDITLVVLKRK